MAEIPPIRISPEGHVAQWFAEDPAVPRRWLCMKWTDNLTAEWLTDDAVADWTPMVAAPTGEVDRG